MVQKLIGTSDLAFDLPSKSQRDGLDPGMVLILVMALSTGICSEIFLYKLKALFQMLIKDLTQEGQTLLIFPLSDLLRTQLRQGRPFTLPYF
jgi:hypothetical protein